MARPRKTIEELKRTGTYRPSRHGGRDAEATAGTTEQVCRPDDLTPSAVILWDRLLIALEGSVTAADTPMLAEGVKWLDEAARCREGLAGMSPSTLEYGRLLRAASVAAAAADKILMRFPLDPKTRSRLPAPVGVKPAATVETRPKTALDLAGPMPEAEQADACNPVAAAFDGPGLATQPKTKLDMAGPLGFAD